jgi:hypothetical protein
LVRIKKHLLRNKSQAILLVLPLLISCQLLSSVPENPIPSTATAKTTDSPILTAEGITAVPEVTIFPEPSPVPENINPLTGLPVDDASILNRNPVLIKVSNYPRTGRPHAGLSSADIVFDYYIGEMFNRFLAVFYGNNAPQVGPIRSGRLVDAQLTQMFRGILVYGNADERVDTILNQQLGSRALPSKFSPCPPVCGDDTHSVTGVFADSAAVTEYARSIGIPQENPGLQFASFTNDPPPGGQPGNKLLVQYAEINKGEWEYDSASGKYLRWIEDGNEGEPLTMIPLVDRNTGEQLAFSNVIILYTFYIEFNRTLHNIDIWNNQGSRKALFLRDGQAYGGTWQVSDHSQPFEFLQNDGTPMLLKPGNTWIILAGISSKITIPQGGSFELFFYSP